MTTYADIKDFTKKIGAEWENVVWEKVASDNCNAILDKPGIYRLIVIVNRAIRIPNEYKVCGIADAEISGELSAGTVLSVGKTKKLRTRIKQHFGNNKNNNRLKKRLLNIGIKIDLESPLQVEALVKILNDNQLELQYSEIDEWWKRDLLEAYGRAISAAFFDLEIEH